MEEDRTVRKESERKNRLAGERSPYLRQHADNPVDWYPWGEEAFQKAEREDKPVFLSIGYSTCHWCHVMAAESFRDEGVAKLINASFVPVKVDREERPDVDSTYMMAAQLLSGRGGWPLTIIMTPDKRPFFAATYLPKETRPGMTGLTQVLEVVSQYWKTRRGEIETASGNVVKVLRELVGTTSGEGMTAETMAEAARRLGEGFDETYGGFGPPPKFPTPHLLTMLLRNWLRTGDRRSLHMADHTLEMMRAGGIFDQLEGGFHRYSVDRGWMLPHFEKMLYDQALLAVAYLEAWQATGKEAHARTAREVLDYVLNRMISPEGLFYSAEDADSEGEEGKFYVWREDELEKVLAPEELELARRYFGVSKEGNVVEGLTRRKEGKNVLRLAPGAVPGDPRFEELRAKLRAARDQRTRPLKDDKAMTDWNGLMIGAMARAGAVLPDRRYTAAAARSANTLLTTMRRPDGSLLHVRRGGGEGIDGYLEDHAFLAGGLLELYQADLDPKWLEAALDLTKTMTDRFWDPEGGGFFMTAPGAEDVLHRKKEFYDGAVPSGNSAALMDLLVLGRVTGDADMRDRAERTVKAFSGAIARAPEAFSAFLSAVDFSLGPSYSAVISGKRGEEDTGRLLGELNKRFVPNKVVLLNEPRPAGDAVRRLSPLVEGHEMKDGKATVQICTEKECLEETNDPLVLAGQFKKRKD